MNGLLQAIRYAARQLRKNPGFAAVAVATLAFGIAANTVIFSVMNATILKPLNFSDANRLVLPLTTMRWVAIGILAGVIGALFLTRLPGSLLYEIKPTNPVVLGGVALRLAGVALFASYLPARKAAKVDPMVALRYE